MENAVQYMYDLGRRKIGFITFPFENQTTIRRRHEGYCSALKKNNLEYDSNIVIIDDQMRLSELKGTYALVMQKIEQKKFRLQ